MKKKSDPPSGTSQLSVNSEETQTPLPTSPQLGEEHPKLGGGEEEKEYTTGAWKGVPHYVCKACGFDAFYEMVMLRHLVDKHNSEMALERLVGMEAPSQPSPKFGKAPNLGEGGAEEVYEVELVETGSAVDAQGIEHKKFTIKE